MLLEGTWKVDPRNIRFWRGAPTIFLLFTTERMLANPYTYKSEAYQTVTFEIARTGSSEDIFSQYALNHFQRAWDSSDVVSWYEAKRQLVKEPPIDEHE
jgi:flavin-binding protein dodecin